MQLYLLRVHPEVSGPDPLHDGHGGVVLGAVREEGRATREQDVHDHAEAPQVAALVVAVVVSLQLFDLCFISVLCTIISKVIEENAF